MVCFSVDFVKIKYFLWLRIVLRKTVSLWAEEKKKIFFFLRLRGGKSSWEMRLLKKNTVRKKGNREETEFLLPEWDKKRTYSFCFVLENDFSVWGIVGWYSCFFFLFILILRRGKKKIPEMGRRLNKLSTLIRKKKKKTRALMVSCCMRFSYVKFCWTKLHKGQK